jgi:hypothetical protein
MFSVPLFEFQGKAAAVLSGTFALTDQLVKTARGRASVGANSGRREQSNWNPVY